MRITSPRLLRISLRSLCDMLRFSTVVRSLELIVEINSDASSAPVCMR